MTTDQQIEHGIPTAAFQSTNGTPQPLPTVNAPTPATPADPTDTIHVDELKPGEDEGFIDCYDPDVLLSTSDEKTEWVTVPEWGMRLLVRSLQGYERDAYENSLFIGNAQNRVLNLRNARAKLVVLSVIHPVTHQRLFRDDQVVALARKNAAALDRVATVAQYLSGLRERDMQEMVGNSSGDLNVDSTSESP